MGLSQLRALELEPATQGSHELAHLGLGGKLRAAGSSAHLAPLSLCQTGSRSGIPEPPAEPVKKAVEEDACSAPSRASWVLLPLWALTPPGPGSAVVFFQTLAEAPALYKGIAGWWANLSQGTGTLSISEKYSRGVSGSELVG